MATSKILLGSFFVFCVAFQAVVALQGEVVVYWGQGPDSEQELKHYCQDSTYDIIVLAFVHDFPTASGDTYPSMELNYCYTSYPGHPQMLSCPSVASDIQYCQSKGKKIFMSFGGSGGTYGFTSSSQAQTFATLVWNTFLGGNGPVRPFGSTILDGIDLDIEHGSSTGYGDFINKLRTYFVGAPRAYYISSAPQCPYPDDWMGPGAGLALTNAWFDYVWVQFYNNNCGLDRYPSKFNFNTWANWAATASLNKNVKVLIGAPGSSISADTGYVSASTLQTISNAMYTQYPNVFGGVMLWEAGQAEANNNYGAQVAAFLHSGAPNPPPAPASPVTTGSKSKAAPTPVAVTTGGKTKTGSAPSPPPVSTPAQTCTSSSEGHMKCATSETYQTCTHGAWTVSQSCAHGLTCTPSGSYIYCE